MHILFIHEKESDPKNSSKAQAIKNRFREWIVLVPDYKPKERSFEEIDEFFKNYFKQIPFLQTEELYIIGSSLGGYWALKWASQLNALGCTLINPDLKYYVKLPTWLPLLPVNLLVCKDDTVVDPNFAVNLFTGQDNGMIVIYEAGGHQMEDTEDMLFEINEAIHSHWDRFDD